MKDSMGRSPIHLTVLVCCAALWGVLGTMANLAYAASAREKAEVKRPPNLVATRHAAKPPATRKGHIAGPRTGMVSKNKKPSNRQARKALRGRKPMPSEAAAESMPNLAQRGLLTPPHRYHLDQGDRRSVVVSPRSGDLAQDHFLELDKNRDGVIDPLERATGRLDIERDVSTR
jgi:hypothetical protein